MKLFCTVIFICYAFISAAQQPAFYNIKGTLLDSADKKPALFITIKVLNEAKKPVKGTISKDDGSFNLDRLPAGNYMLEFTAVGYKFKSVSVSLSSGSASTYQAGNIYLSKAPQSLREVTVSTRKPLVKQEIDRIIYDVQNDPESMGSSMLDLIPKIPLLSIEGEDNIRMKGSSDFKVLINGRSSGMVARNPAMALRMLKASNVLRVEVITTPPSRYDAEGLAGVINIVTKSIPAGYNIILEAFNNTRVYEGIGGAFEFREGKMGFNGYAGSWQKNFGRNYFDNIITPAGWTQPGVEQTGNAKTNGPNTPASLDYSFEIDSLNLITASAALSYDLGRLDGSQLGNSFNTSRQLTQSFELANVSSTEKNGLDIGVNYQRGFRNLKERLLTFSYSHSESASNYNGENNTVSSFNYNTQLLKQRNKNGYSFNTFQLDYVSPMGKVNLEAGVKAILRNNFSDFFIETYNTTSPAQLINIFNYLQNVYSAYNSYQIKGENWGLKAGARLELTTISTGPLTNNYLNLIPSVAIQHKFKNSQSINLGYTQRIQRPNITQLNPFENRTNPLFYSSGNPNLVPVTSNNFDLNYTIIRKAVTNISFNYAVANKTIQNVVIQGTDGITRSTFANIGKYANLGTNLSVSYPIAKGLNFSFNGRLAYVWLDATVNNLGYKNEGTTGDLTGNLSYRFKNDWVYTFRFSAYANTVNLQGGTKGFTTAYTRLAKEFFNRKLGLIASVNNPFFRYRKLVTNYSSDNATQVYTENTDIRALYINVYYTFGHLKEKIRKNKRNISNDDLEKEKTPN